MPVATELADEVILTGDGNGNGNATEAAATPAVDAVQQRAELLVTQHMTRLLEIPGIAEILKASKEGRKVHVLGDDDLARFNPQPAAVAKEEADPDFDSMTQKDILSWHQKKTIGALLPELKKLIQEHTAPLAEKLGFVEQDVQGRRKQSLQQQITTTAAKYTDWKDMEPHMLDMVQRDPGLRNRTPEQLYVLTKMEMGQPIVATNRGTESERPTHTAATPPVKSESPRGRADFTTFLQQTLKQAKLGDGLGNQTF